MGDYQQWQCCIGQLKSDDGELPVRIRDLKHQSQVVILVDGQINAARVIDGKDPGSYPYPPLMAGMDLGIEPAHILFFGKALFENLSQRFVRSSERSDVFSDLRTRSFG